jgi:hypothetical protein
MIMGPFIPEIHPDYWGCLFPEDGIPTGRCVDSRWTNLQTLAKQLTGRE